MVDERSRLLISVTLGLGLSFLLHQLKRSNSRRRSRTHHIPRFDSNGRVEDLAEALRQSGVVVVEDVVPSDKTDALLDELSSARGVFHGKVGSFGGHHTLRNAAKPLGESKVAQELAVHPLILGTVERILRPWCKRINLGTCSMISVQPPPTAEDPPAPPQVLHRDNTMWGASSWPFLPSSASHRPELSVSVMWAVSDFTRRNGATRFLVGSHHQLPAPGETYGGKGEDERLQDLEKEVVPATMPKGSVVLWCGNTLHGAGAHAPREAHDDEEPSTRHGLLFIYNLGWLKSEHNFHYAIPAQIIQSFSPKLCELLGRFGQNAVEHEWFTGPIYTQPYLGGPEGSKAGEGVQF